MKQIPDTMALVRVQRDNTTPGFKETQFHRNEEHRVGVITVFGHDGRKIQRWYCDCLPGVATQQLSELVALMAVSSDEGDTEAVTDWPRQLDSADVSAEDFPEGVPQCMINAEEEAVGRVLVGYSWHPCDIRTLFIGPTASETMQADEDPDQFVLDTLEATNTVQGDLIEQAITGDVTGG